MATTTAIPRRALGRTGETVSALGMGGYHLGLVGAERDVTSLVRGDRNEEPWRRRGAGEEACGNGEGGGPLRRGRLHADVEGRDVWAGGDGRIETVPLRDLSATKLHRRNELPYGDQPMTGR